MEKIKSILEQLVDAVLICDEHSEIVFVNIACAHMFGYEQKELIGTPLSSLMATKYQKNHESITKNFITTQTKSLPMMARRLIPCTNAKGEEFTARISVSSVVIDEKTYGVAIIQDYTSFKEELLSVELKSKVDSLTNLYNRRYLDNVLKPNSRILNSWNYIGVLYIDLDKFKPINDEHGHNVGDFVLKIIANRIKERVRYNDIPLRLGGDEFLILVNLVDSDITQKVLKELGRIIHSEIIKPIHINEKVINIGASIGIGCYPDDSNNLEELIILADKAMFKAKKAKTSVESVSPLGK